MPSISIEDFKTSDKQLVDYFQRKHLAEAPPNLKLLFKIAMRDKSLFPNFNLPNDKTYEDYIDRWVNNYIETDRAPARLKSAKPKGSCNDPAVKAIVKAVTHASDEEATAQESHHNLFMSAENIQGALLEEYIDSVISKHGWVWCKGNALRAVDFCTADGEILLQVKNKSNTENSSSSNIRKGTNIMKWYRLGTKTSAEEKLPDYKWDILNKIITKISGKPCNLCEGDYVKYIEDVAMSNPKIITDK
jgi:hypothetical protein